jgi:hypothetical protein
MRVTQTPVKVSRRRVYTDIESPHKAKAAQSNTLPARSYDTDEKFFYRTKRVTMSLDSFDDLLYFVNSSLSMK